MSKHLQTKGRRERACDVRARFVTEATNTQRGTRRYDNATVFMLAVLAIHAPAVCRADAAASDSTWTWIRRALAPSAANRAVQACSLLTQVDEATPYGIVSNDAAYEGKLEAGRGRSTGLFGAGQASSRWMHRAFAPSHDVEQSRAQDDFRAAHDRLSVCAPKLSRVSVDVDAGTGTVVRAKTAMEWGSPPVNAMRRSMAIRGGGNERTVEQHEGVRGCRGGDLHTGPGKTMAGKGSSSLAFIRGDSVGMIGSCGCNRDWKQLVQSAASRMQHDTGSDAACGRFSSRAGQPRGKSARRPLQRQKPFRLSRTVEVEPSAGWCAGGSMRLPTSSRRAEMRSGCRIEG